MRFLKRSTVPRHNASDRSNNECLNDKNSSCGSGRRNGDERRDAADLPASGLRFSALVFVMTFLFWEFFTPFNLLGEPLQMIALELLFWGFIALADGLTIAALIGEETSEG
jgi:hypothetical protein